MPTSWCSRSMAWSPSATGRRASTARWCSRSRSRSCTSCRRRVGRVPMLLLDDVSSELDATRSRRFFALLAELGGQVFLTTTQPELILLEHGRRDFRVEAGVVRGSSCRYRLRPRMALELERLQDTLAGIETVGALGHLRSAIGLALSADVPGVRLGELCEIRAPGGGTVARRGGRLSRSGRDAVAARRRRAGSGPTTWCARPSSA